MAYRPYWSGRAGRINASCVLQHRRLTDDCGGPRVNDQPVYHTTKGIPGWFKMKNQSGIVVDSSITRYIEDPALRGWYYPPVRNGRETGIRSGALRRVNRTL